MTKHIFLIQGAGAGAYEVGKQQDCRDIELIFQEIQDQGFKGSIRTLYRFVKSLRQRSLPLPAPSVLDRVSVQSVKPRCYFSNKQVFFHQSGV